MKKVMFFVNDTTINTFVGGGVQLSLPDNTNVIDVIRTADEVIKRKGAFPLPEYGSLLHMVYNPIEDRFYVQVGIHAYSEPGKALDVRNDTKKILPHGAQIIISPQAGCIGDWEDVLDYEQFCQEMKLRGKK